MRLCHLEGEKQMLKTWEDVDNALKGLCEIEIEKGQITASMNKVIAAAKECATVQYAPLEVKAAKLKNDIETFVKSSRSDITGKSKELNYGKVGFRKTTTIDVPADKIEAIFAKIRKLGMDKCISVKEHINKNVLKAYSDSELKKVGCSRIEEDVFFMTVDVEKLKAISE
jgi:phage host-nuclease inhibitor protein Gam